MHAMYCIKSHKYLSYVKVQKNIFGLKYIHLLIKKLIKIHKALSHQISGEI